jgi:hypothetical protein
MSGKTKKPEKNQPKKKQKIGGIVWRFWRNGLHLHAVIKQKAHNQ